MNRTDTHQTWRALTRCAAELRGIAARLREDEPDAGDAIEAAAVAVLGLWPALHALAGQEVNNANG